MTYLPETHPIRDTVLPLLAIDGRGDGHPAGTAFFVAPGLAVTACHILKALWRRIEKVELTKEVVANLPGPAGFALVVHRVVDGRGSQWDAIRMWAADPLDIVFIEFVERGVAALPVDWPISTFRFVPPAIGERVFAIGFPAQAYHNIAASTFSWEKAAKISTGIVREVHLQRRDAHLLPCPSMQTTARFEAGMSGGPVVTADGAICGVVSTGMEQEDEAEDVSYASLLWPLMSFSFDGLRFVSPPGASITFRSLFEGNYLDSPDWKHVRLIDDGRSVVLSVPAS